MGETETPISRRTSFRPPAARRLGLKNVFVPKESKEIKEAKEDMKMCNVCTEEIVPASRPNYCDGKNLKHYTCITCACALSELICPECRGKLTKVSFIRGFEDLKANVARKARAKEDKKARIAEYQAGQVARGEAIDYDYEPPEA